MRQLVSIGDIAENLTKAGWRCRCISSTDHEGRQFWVAAAERDDAGRFIVRADEKLTAFVELEAARFERQRAAICLLVYRAARFAEVSSQEVRRKETRWLLAALSSHQR
jgi:hypothetical protein